MTNPTPLSTSRFTPWEQGILDEFQDCLDQYAAEPGLLEGMAGACLSIVNREIKQANADLEVMKDQREALMQTIQSQYQTQDALLKKLEIAAKALEESARDCSDAGCQYDCQEALSQISSFLPKP